MGCVATCDRSVSLTRDVAVLMVEGGRDSGGVLYEITTWSAVALGEASWFPQEADFLLKPEVQMVVTSVKTKWLGESQVLYCKLTEICGEDTLVF